MTANPSSWGVDFDEYLRFELEAEERHELIDGQIVAMAGATRRHNRLCERLRDAIRPCLGDGPCVLDGSDQRLAVLAGAKGWVGYYPDLAVYRTDEVHVLNRDTRTNPRLVVEVTSKSTDKNDRGVKLQDYLQVQSLEEYLIVSHQRQDLELWSRTGERWQRQVVTEGTLRLRCGAVIDVARLYDGVPD
ncbi:MAG TPA: Uma2 family endonuclease [Polyangiaceae bacterium]|jgi:Uma2 family endonuclease|nr:Uma2 family endonuclease [Polyangiaceae bacterium]